MILKLPHATFETQDRMTVWRLPDRVWFDSPGRSVDQRSCRRYLVKDEKNKFGIFDHEDVINLTDMPEDEVEFTLLALPVAIQ